MHSQGAMRAIKAGVAYSTRLSSCKLRQCRCSCSRVRWPKHADRYYQAVSVPCYAVRAMGGFACTELDAERDGKPLPGLVVLVRCGISLLWLILHLNCCSRPFTRIRTMIDPHLKAIFGEPIANRTGGHSPIRFEQQVVSASENKAKIRDGQFSNVLGCVTGPFV
jgi:hypothetical protein